MFTDATQIDTTGYFEPVAVDARFEIIPWEEPEMGCTHTVVVIELLLVPADATWPLPTIVDGREIERYTTDDPFGHVEQFRQCQEMSMEERHAPFGPEWEREQRERLGMFA